MDISNVYQVLKLANTGTSAGISQIKYFYQLWQQHKQLRTMVINETWFDIYDGEFTCHFPPRPTEKLKATTEIPNLKTDVQGTSLEQSQRPSISLYDEKEHPVHLITGGKRQLPW